MILTNIIAFPGNDKPKDRRAVSGEIVTWPVIPIKRSDDDKPPMLPSQRAIRIMNLRTMMRMDSV